MSYAKRADYSRICVDCANHSLIRGIHHCSAARSLITGDTIIQMCTSARAKDGCCGAEGSRYVASGVIQIEPRRVEKKNASAKV